MKTVDKDIIEIQEDFRVPGTDVILEAGDKIEVLSEKSLTKQSIIDALVKSGKNAEKAKKMVSDKAFDYIQRVYGDQNISPKKAAEILMTVDIKESSLPSRMVRDYEMRAQAERGGGGSIDINYQIPTVAVEMSDGSEYFFQGEEADDLLNEVPDNINEEDFILAIAQGW